MLSHLGLDRLARHLPTSWPTLTAGPVRRLLGDRDAAGAARPFASSAAALFCGGVSVWIPAPETSAEPGLAPIYRHADRLLVLPHLRQFTTDPSDGDPEYLTLSHWLEDAFIRWRLPAEDGSTTLAALLAGFAQPTDAALALLGLLVRYALLGSDRPLRRRGLTFPRGIMWLRPIGDSELSRLAARQLVLTVRLKLDPDARQALPTTDVRAAAYRITPAAPRDFGIDPVHTPEGPDVRLLGRLGTGVTIGDDRRLFVPAGVTVPLSVSTSRIPFAGHDDPRRLLMAANMQLQAMPLVTPETPLVRVESDGIDPSGVNLRVAYLAWQGLNHEDAWVLSESAAAKLTAIRDTTVTLLVRTVEMTPTWHVAEGDTVAAGRRLLDRFAAPALLTDDLATLAGLADLLDVMPLEPEPGDLAPVAGVITRLEVLDLHSGDGLPEGLEVPDDVRAATRSIHRLTIRETLPLAVGDKLANRHGHKGIVGAILPDEEMPLVNGQSAEALIDPISVLNRSNWGQVHECRAASEPLSPRYSGGRGVGVRGALPVGEGSDTPSPPPPLPRSTGGEGRRPEPLITGPQFILRLPQIAREKATVAPAHRVRTGLRYRPQRLGEMEHWALWAHAASTSGTGSLSPEAELLRRLLAVAGIALERGDAALSVTGLDLAGSLAEGAIPFQVIDRAEATAKRLGVRSLRDLYDHLETLTESAVLEFPEVLPDVSTPLGLRPVRWLPILPATDRPPRRLYDGSEQAHDLTLAYRRILRLARPWFVAVRRADVSLTEESETDDALPEPNLDLTALCQSVAHVMHEAYTLAVGRRATGQDSNKFAHLRRKVLGRRLSGSARAVVAPAGPLGLALDEIGLPEPLFAALLGPDAEAGQTVWLKRDPVLHRFGLLAVRARLVPGYAIRLPASLLGPLGADYDGDTVAIFAAIPGCEPPPDARPHRNAVHDLTGKALFIPGKQYVYGLSLLEESSEALARFNAAVSAAGAPTWPTGEKNTAARLQTWLTRVTATPNPLPEWWSLLESHALAALAADPGMGLTLTTATELPRLRAVACGAAKNLYDDATGMSLAEDYLAGRSLDRYRKVGSGTRLPFDPIAEVMVAARNAIGRFGGALRRLVFALPSPTPRDLRLAQTLTEQTTQKALSVKAGQPPVSVQAFEMQLRRLLQGEAWDLPPDDDLGRILEPLRAIWDELARRFRDCDAAPWLDWLRAPHELVEILTQTHVLRLPLDDVRVSAFLGE